MTDWDFEVQGPQPGLNHSYKIVTVGPRCPTCGRGPSRLAKEEGVEVWQQAVAWTVKSRRPTGWTPARRTFLEIEWYTPRAKDGDSSLKALLDGVAMGLGCDDKGFLPLVVVNEIDKANPRTVVRVRND